MSKENKISQFLCQGAWLGIALIVMAAVSLPAAKANTTTDFGLSYPPIADSTQRDLTANEIAALSAGSNDLTIIRIGENWANREPIQGTYDWAGLDAKMAWAAQNNLDVMMTIPSNGPDWACQLPRSGNSCVFTNLTAFEDYIEALVARYPGQIAKIQFSNEWQTSFGYSGTNQQFIDANNTLYTAVKSIDPTIEVVLGGFSTVALRYIAFCSYLVDEVLEDDGTIYDASDRNGICSSSNYQTAYNRVIQVLGNANYDLVDAHLYDDYSNWSIYYDMLKGAVSVPVIVSEFGGPHPVLGAQLTEQEQAYELEQYMNTLRTMSVPEAYFFSLVELGNNTVHGDSGLLDQTTLLREPSWHTFYWELHNY